MKITIKIDTELEQDENTFQWIAHQQAWQNCLFGFYEYLRMKYKYESPKGSEELQTARLSEFEEIKEKFFNLVTEHNCHTDFL